MAIRTISNAGGNWNATTAWVGGVVPTAVDDVVATATSGPLSLNTTAVAKSINFTNYVNTFSLTSGTLSIAGNLTFSTGMTITGTSSTLAFNASATWTSNGKTWTGNYIVNTAALTITLADAAVINGNVTHTSGGTTHTINGFTLNVNGNITASSGRTFTGTTKYIFSTTTTQTITVSGTFQSNIDINASGTVTFGTVNYNTGTLTYITGTVVTTGSTLNLSNVGTPTLATNGISWNNITISTGTTVILTNALDVNGTFTYGSGGSGVTLNGSTATFGGNITASGTNDTGSTLSGTTNITIDGTGTWSHSSSFNAIITNNLTINTAGTLTIGSKIGYNTGTLTYTTGTVTTTGSTLTIGASTTLNCAGIAWNNITISASITITLASNLNIGGVLTINGILQNIGTYAINVSGGLTLNERVQQTSGTTTLNILGGTWSASTVNSVIRLNTNINGNVTISGNVYYTTGILTYVAGTVTTSGSTLNITTTSCTLNTNGIIWNNVTSGATGVAIDLTSDLNINGTLTTTASSVLTFNGTYNITVAGGVVANERIQKITGTPTLIITGGTWSCGAAGVILINTNINGNVTISGTVNYHTGTLTYISGTVLTGGSTLSTLLTAVTFNTDGIAWNNVALGVLTTLTSNLTVNGLLTTSTVINGSNIYANGGITVSNNSSGTTVIWLQGGTWSGAGMIRNNTFINGNIRISGSVAFNNATLTYSSGTVVAKGSTLNINGVSTTLINIHKINFDTVIITSGFTVTMNEFFSGSPNLPVKVQASSAATNYTITFQNGFEKIAKYVKVSNMTLTNTAASRGSLLILNNKGKYFTGGNNVGNIRYTNSSPNGIAKGNPTVPNSMTAPIGGYLSDPVFN